MQFIDFRGQNTLSFRQIDELNGLPKGSAFRRFKRLRDWLEEGVDYHYLSATDEATRIEALRREGRIYSGTHHLVLITERGYHRLQSGE